MPNDYKILTPVYNLGKALREYFFPHSEGSSERSHIPETVVESVEGKRPDSFYMNPQQVLSKKDRVLSSIPKIAAGDNYHAPESLFRNATGPVRIS